MPLLTPKTDQRGPRSLYVQPNDVVVPIRERRGKDGSVSAEMGDPIEARELWKETNDGRD